MGAIPDEIIQRVREAHDIVEIVGRSLQLKRAGSAWKACCPFHEEKTPSFQVNPRLQIFKCFGCGKGGNVFHWLMETRGMTFPESVEMLAEERSIEVPRTARGDPGASRDARRRLADGLAFAHDWFRHVLASTAGAEARAYLGRRGYDAAFIQTLGLGFAPPGWDGLCQAAARKGLPATLLEEAGLAKRRDRGGGHYDAFRHRVIFPIHDAQGRLVTFAGRTLDADEPAKYINGPETAVFHKSRVLYALDRAVEGIRRRGEALVMEGYTDVLMAHRHGFDHAVAGMGTAFTDAQARLLGRFTERAVLLYDGDAAGQAAAERTLEVLLPAGFAVRVAVLPPGRDVDEILLEEGADALEAVLSAARDWFDHRMARERERHDLGTDRGRSDAAEALLDTVLKVRSDIERQLRFKSLAEELGGDLSGTDAETIIRRLAAKRDARAARQGGPGAVRPRPPTPPRDRARDRHSRLSQMAYLAGALAEPDLADAVFRAVGGEEFTDPVLARLFEALLDLQEAGRPLEREVLAAHLAQDAEALAALAELPEDPALAEQVRYEIGFLERRRAQREREAHIRAQIQAAGEGRPLGAVAGGGADPEAAAGPRSVAVSERGAPPATRPAEGTKAAARPATRPAAPEGTQEDARADAGGLPCEEFDPAYDLPVLDGPDGEFLPPEDDAFDSEA